MDGDHGCAMDVRRRGGRRSRKSSEFSQAIMQPQVMIDGPTYQEPRWLFRAFFEQAPCGMFYLSQEGRFVYTNPRFCALVGYTSNELQGKSWFPLMHIEERSGMRTFLRCMRSERSSLPAVQERGVHFYRKGGIVVQLHLTIMLLKNTDRNTMSDGEIYYAVSCEDVPGQHISDCFYDHKGQLVCKKFSAAMEERRQMDDFLALVVHELKSSLTIIKGNIQLIERRLQIATQKQSMSRDVYDAESILLQVADRQVGRTNKLMNNLLDVSRIRIGRMKMGLAQCNLIEVLRKAVTACIHTMPACEIRFDLSDPVFQSPLLVYADAARIEQVIGHYLENAIKYASLKKPVDVYVQVVDRKARVCIRDYGPGIALEQQENIWQCFYHSEKKTYETGASAAGLGVGLYISQAIIDYHRGHVGVWSLPGHGSTFWFTLPLNNTDVSS